MGYICTSGYALNKDLSIPDRCNSYCENVAYKSCKECSNIINEEIIDKLNACEECSFPMTAEEVQFALGGKERRNF